MSQHLAQSDGRSTAALGSLRPSAGASLPDGGLGTGIQNRTLADQARTRIMVPAI